jgi:hypothetical protein
LSLSKHYLSQRHGIVSGSLLLKGDESSDENTDLHVKKREDDDNDYVNVECIFCNVKFSKGKSGEQ